MERKIKADAFTAKKDDIAKSVDDKLDKEKEVLNMVDGKANLKNTTKDLTNKKSIIKSDARVDGTNEGATYKLCEALLALSMAFLV